MSAALAIALKDLRLLARDKGNVFFTFVFPVLIAIFFGMVFGRGPREARIEIALAVESGSKVAAGLAEDLVADGSFVVERVASREDAVARVRAGEASAAIVLPASLEDDVDALFAGGAISIDAIVDPARRAEAGLVQGKLNELAFRQLPKVFGDSAQRARMFAGARARVARSEMPAGEKLRASALITAAETFLASDGAGVGAGVGAGTDSGTGLQGAWRPVSVDVTELPPRTGRPRSSFDVTFPQGAVWGLAGCMGAFASALVLERTRGTMARLLLAPITRLHLIAGKGLACFASALIVQALLIGLAVVGFGSVVAQPFMLAAACLASAFAFAGLAMALAAFCRTEAEADGAARGAILILALVGGGTIPLFFMPPFLRTLSYGSPFRWAVMALEGPFWRDLSLSEQLPPLAVLVALGLGGFFIGCRALPRSATRS